MDKISFQINKIKKQFLPKLQKPIQFKFLVHIEKVNKIDDTDQYYVKFNYLDENRIDVGETVFGQTGQKYYIDDKNEELKIKRNKLASDNLFDTKLWEKILLDNEKTFEESLDLLLKNLI